MSKKIILLTLIVVFATIKMFAGGCGSKQADPVVAPRPVQHRTVVVAGNAAVNIYNRGGKRVSTRTRRTPAPQAGANLAGLPGVRQAPIKTVQGAAAKCKAQAKAKPKAKGKGKATGKKARVAPNR